MRSRYRLGELLGSGGLGEVFRATKLGAEGFERAVAVKRIRPELAQQERFVRLFIRKAQVLSRLAHPNVVSAWGFDRDTNGQLFLVMEYVDGVDLKKLIDSGPLPHPVVIFIVTEILNGLGHAHHLPQAEGAIGAVHRDLSPHNVLLSWEGAVKVADFGLAKFQWSRHVSASFDLQGKVAFMSPEQAAHQPLDGRSDLFSVGVMLWEMLTGERLFAREHEDATATKWRVLTDRIEPPGVFRPVAVDLEAVVMRLLDRDPAQRYPSAGAARAALIACEGASKLARQELERILVSRFPKAFAQRALAVAQTFRPTSRSVVSEGGALMVAEKASAAPRRTRAAEQRLGQSLDGCSDLYSVGVMLWELLADERPFTHGPAGEDRFDRGLPRPSVFRPVPRDIEAVVMKLLRRDRTRRFRTAEAAYDAIAECDSGLRLRGRVELVELLAERFPDQADRRPTRRPPMPHTPTPSTPVLPPHPWARRAPVRERWERWRWSMRRAQWARQRWRARRLPRRRWPLIAFAVMAICVVALLVVVRVAVP